MTNDPDGPKSFSQGMTLNSQPQSPTERKRRPRYSGKNPRRFEDRYKELDPVNHPDAISKVIASGKTPAGTHRPIMVTEVLESLSLRPGHHVVDCTLGYGGHAEALLRAIRPGGALLGLDLDPIEQPRTTQRLRSLGFSESEFLTKLCNFAGLHSTLKQVGWPGAHAILADLGISSMQLDDPSRGFTFKVDAPLDLRLNPRRGLSAADWLARTTIPRLERALMENSDEPHAILLAQSLVERAALGSIRSTLDLANALREILKPLANMLSNNAVEDTIRRVFQALRIEVNDEFSALESWLRQLPSCLLPGGRVVVLTFHSGEDRRVKLAFRDGHRAGLYSEVAREVLVAGSEERRSNPRSKSAKLRWAIRSSGQP